MAPTLRTPANVGPRAIVFGVESVTLLIRLTDFCAISQWMSQAMNGDLLRTRIATYTPRMEITF